MEGGKRSEGDTGGDIYSKLSSAHSAAFRCSFFFFYSHQPRSVCPVADSLSRSLNVSFHVHMRHCELLVEKVKKTVWVTWEQQVATQDSVWRYKIGDSSHLDSQLETLDYYLSTHKYLIYLLKRMVQQVDEKIIS